MGLAYKLFNVRRRRPSKEAPILAAKMRGVLVAYFKGSLSRIELVMDHELSRAL